MTIGQLQGLKGQQGQLKPAQVQTNRTPQGVSFDEVLQSAVQGKESVKFSAHAADRLRDRNITLSNEDVLRLNNAVDKAEQKGSKDSLVLMNDLAFVVSVKNKTVVTAMANTQLKENVVTNIDSTVII